MNRTRLGVILIAGITGITGLTACNSTAPSAKKSAEQAASKKKAQPQFVANTKNTPGTLANFVGAHSDASDTKCVQDGKRWNVTGAVKNPTSVDRQYRIYVSFLDGDTTVGVGQADIASVEPKKSGTWKTSVPTTGQNLRCVLRVERARA